MLSATDRLKEGLNGVFGTNILLMILIGLLAGVSIAVLPEESVVLPVGEFTVPGYLLGGVGLLASILGYRKFGCCNGCGSKTKFTGTCDCDDTCDSGG